MQPFIILFAEERNRRGFGDEEQRLEIDASFQRDMQIAEWRLIIVGNVFVKLV